MDASFFDNYGNFEAKLPSKALRDLQIEGKDLTGWGAEDEVPDKLIKPSKKKIAKPIKTLPHQRDFQGLLQYQKAYSSLVKNHAKEDRGTLLPHIRTINQLPNGQSALVPAQGPKGFMTRQNSDEDVRLPEGYG